HFHGVEHRLEVLERVLRPAGAEQLLLVRRVRIADRQLHQEAVELRFRQRVRTDVLDRVLRRDDEERIGQRQAVLLDRDHPLAHRLEQRRLRLRRGPVDLVGEEDVREDRTGDELELLLLLLVNRDADDVGRQQVAGELDALERQRQRARQRVRQRGLADAGDVFEEDVPLRQERGDAELHDLGLAANDALDVLLQKGDAVERAPWTRYGMNGHAVRSTSRRRQKFARNVPGETG